MSGSDAVRTADMARLDLEEEYRGIRRQYRYAALASLLVLGGGSLFYHIVEKFTWVDAVYFCTITLTTIGYGDVAPVTTAGKIFTIFYVILGIGIIAFFVNVLFKNAIVRRQLRHARRLNRRGA